MSCPPHTVDSTERCWIPRCSAQTQCPPSAARQATRRYSIGLMGRGGRRPPPRRPRGGRLRMTTLPCVLLLPEAEKLWRPSFVLCTRAALPLADARQETGAASAHAVSTSRASKQTPFTLPAVGYYFRSPVGDALRSRFPYQDAYNTLSGQATIAPMTEPASTLAAGSVGTGRNPVISTRPDPVGLLRAGSCTQFAWRTRPRCRSHHCATTSSGGLRAQRRRPIRRLREVRPWP